MIFSRNYPSNPFLFWQPRTCSNTYIPVCLMSRRNVETEPPLWTGKEESLESPNDCLVETRMLVSAKPRISKSSPIWKYLTSILLPHLLLMASKAKHLSQTIVVHLSCLCKTLSLTCLSHPRYNRTRVCAHDHRKRFGGGKGQPRQEMQQGILLYHVADTQTERDETVTRDRGSGWSCEFGQRATADIPFLLQNK